ncbi:hypothetical protein ACFL2J_00760 [Candidatus Omnitrophota bacterium]
MFKRKLLVVGIIIGIAISLVAIERLQLWAEEVLEDELQVLCNQLNEFKRYEGKKIGYEETQSLSWEIGKKIIKYEEEATPYLLDIYQNSDNHIAQLFAARLVSEIDSIQGIRMLETFRNSERTVETVFEDSISSMTIADIVKKELAILKDEIEKVQRARKHTKSEI